MERHTITAFCLLGWYLMLAPLTRENGQVTADLSASLSQWSVIQSFDTATECDDAQVKWQNWAKRKADEAPSDEVKQADASAPTQCISSDDSRLTPGTTRLKPSGPSSFNPSSGKRIPALGVPPRGPVRVPRRIKEPLQT